MDFLLLHGRAGEVELYPPARPVSATCRFLSPSGTELSAPTVTVDNLQRTVSAVTSDFSVSVTGATGSPRAGRRYWWVSGDTGAQEALVLLSEVDNDAWTLQQAPPSLTPKVNDLLRGARLTATIPSTATTKRDRNYRVEWTVTCADGVVRIYTSIGHVVRTLYEPACTPTRVRDFLARTWPDLTVNWTYGDYLAMSDRASSRVWRKVRGSGRFQDLLGDPNDFAAAGDVALAIELAKDGYLPPSVIDRSQHMERLEYELQRELDDAMSSRPYDSDDTNDVSDSESSSRPIRAISARRV